MTARLPHAMACLGLLLLLGMCGCQSDIKVRTPANDAHDAVFVVNGVDGPGGWYGGLMQGFEGSGLDVQPVEWGGPLMILPNLQRRPLHDAAQAELASRLAEWRRDHPEGKVVLLGHSAGCGVILGMLAGSDAQVTVDTLILLAPAVSAKYDLKPALDHVRGQAHVFYSEHDELLLKYGTSVAGTYDSVWGESAGLHGFTMASQLPENLRVKLVQHEYDPAWKAMGHGGGHFGWRRKGFVRQVLVPLAKENSQRP